MNIGKIKLEQVKQSYTNYTNVDADVCQLIQEVYSPTIFANMNSITNLINNKTTAIKIQTLVETKYSKIQPKHIESAMFKFWELPHPTQPLNVYFEKQKINCNLFKDTSELSNNATKKRTTQGHLIKIPYLQQTVVDYNKEEIVQAKTLSVKEKIFD